MFLYVYMVVLLCAAVYTFLHVYTCLWVCVHTCGDRRYQISRIFLKYSPPYFWSQALSLRLILTNLALLASQLATGISCYHIPSTGITGKVHILTYMTLFYFYLFIFRIWKKYDSFYTIPKLPCPKTYLCLLWIIVPHFTTIVSIK